MTNNDIKNLKFCYFKYLTIDSMMWANMSWWCFGCHWISVMTLTVPEIWSIAASKDVEIIHIMGCSGIRIWLSWWIEVVDDEWMKCVARVLMMMVRIPSNYWTDMHHHCGLGSGPGQKKNLPYRPQSPHLLIICRFPQGPSPILLSSKLDHNLIKRG